MENKYEHANRDVVQSEVFCIGKGMHVLLEEAFSSHKNAFLRRHENIRMSETAFALNG